MRAGSCGHRAHPAPWPTSSDSSWRSAYIWFFLCPGAPELAIRSGATVKVFEAVERIGRSRRAAGAALRRPGRSTTTSTGSTCTAPTCPGRFWRPGQQLPQTTVPVQVLVARKDYFVTPALQRFTGSIPDGSRVVPIEGGHWVVASHPDVIARLTGEWVDLIIEGTAPAGEPGMSTRQK